MTCRLCLHWSPRRNPEMARQSFALCNLGSDFTFFSPTHTCPRYEKASAEQRKAQMPKRQQKAGIVPRETSQDKAQWWLE